LQGDIPPRLHFLSLTFPSTPPSPDVLKSVTSCPFSVIDDDLGELPPSLRTAAIFARISREKNFSPAEPHRAEIAVARSGVVDDLAHFLRLLRDGELTPPVWKKVMRAWIRSAPALDSAIVFLPADLSSTPPLLLEATLWLLSFRTPRLVVQTHPPLPAIDPPLLLSRCFDPQRHTPPLQVKLKCAQRMPPPLMPQDPPDLPAKGARHF
jgi:hypothetical protein